MEKNGESFFYARRRQKEDSFFTWMRGKPRRLFICVHFLEREASPRHLVGRARTRRSFGPIFSDEGKGIEEVGISEASAAAETHTLPFYERSRCSTMLETATRVALRSRESAQEVAHFRYRSR